MFACPDSNVAFCIAATTAPRPSWEGGPQFHVHVKRITDLRPYASVGQIGSPGSPLFAALRNLPVFVESNPQHTYKDHFDGLQTTGNNYNGRWTLFAQAVDVLAGTDVVPNESPLPCVMRYEDGAREIEGVVAATPCTTFPEPTVHVPVVPAAVYLKQNYPNPFNPETHIDSGLPARSHVTLEIFDLRGARVASLLEEARDAGSHQVLWDGTDQRGVGLPSGVYFYRLTVDGKTETRKLSLIR